MKNNLLDLNNHLFAQLEKLGDDNLSEEELAKEIKRSKAIAAISTDIVKNAKVVLDSRKFMAENGVKNVELPPMLAEKNPHLLGLKDE